MKKFNNRENECVTDTQGREHWISRSVAVVGVVVVVCDYEIYFLVGKRGLKAADHKGMWNLPCGYLDWDETGVEACLREIYEETGLDVDFEHKTDPYRVSTKTDNNRQNVSLYYYFGTVVSPEGFEKIKSSLTTEHCEEGEVEELKFINSSEVDDYDFCFGHEKEIARIIELEKSKLTQLY